MIEYLWSWFLILYFVHNLQYHCPFRWTQSNTGIMFLFFICTSRDSLVPVFNVAPPPETPTAPPPHQPSTPHCLHWHMSTIHQTQQHTFQTYYPLSNLFSFNLLAWTSLRRWIRCCNLTDLSNFSLWSVLEKRLAWVFTCSSAFITVRAILERVRSTELSNTSGAVICLFPSSFINTFSAEVFGQLLEHLAFIVLLWFALDAMH